MNVKKRTKSSSSPLNSTTPQAIKLKKTSTSLTKRKIQREEYLPVKAGILMKQVEKYFDSNNIAIIDLFPSVCGSYDSTVCQMISRYDVNICDSMHQFNDPLISISWKLMTAKSSGKIISEEIELLEEFALFHGENFVTKKEITSKLLSQLLLWLSWLDNPIDFFTKSSWLNGIVDKLLKILKSKPKDPKTLSTAVACLAYLIVGHSAANSVLTDNNVNQLLKLCLNRSVHPDNNEIGLLEWDIVISRLGLRKLLEIPKVRDGKTTNTEIISFVLKWWSRLADAANNYTIQNSSNHHHTTDISNTQKSVNNNNLIYDIPGQITGKQGVPCLRAALDVISDIYERVDTVRDALANSITTEGGSGLYFLTVYLNSNDYNTAVSASSLLTQILSHLNQKYHINETISTTTTMDVPVNMSEDISLPLLLNSIVDVASEVFLRLDQFNTILTNIPSESDLLETEITLLNTTSVDSSKVSRRQTRKKSKPLTDHSMLPVEQRTTNNNNSNCNSVTDTGNTILAGHIVVVPVIQSLVQVLQAINFCVTTLSNNQEHQFLELLNNLQEKSHTINIIRGTLGILCKNLEIFESKEKNVNVSHTQQNTGAIIYLLMVMYALAKKDNTLSATTYHDFTVTGEKENDSNYSNTISPNEKSDKGTCRYVKDDVTQLLQYLVQLAPSNYLLLNSTLDYMELQIKLQGNGSIVQKVQQQLEVSPWDNLINPKELPSIINCYKSIMLDLAGSPSIAMVSATIDPDNTTNETPVIKPAEVENSGNSPQSPELPSLPLSSNYKNSNNNNDNIYNDIDLKSSKDENPFATTTSTTTNISYPVSSLVTQLPDQPSLYDDMTVDPIVYDHPTITTTIASVVTDDQIITHYNFDKIKSIIDAETSENNHSIVLIQQLDEIEKDEMEVSDINTGDHINEDTINNHENTKTINTNTNDAIKPPNRVTTPILISKKEINAIRTSFTNSEETVTPESQRITETPMSVGKEEDDDEENYESDMVEVDRRKTGSPSEYSPRRSYPHGGPFSDNTVWRKAREEKFGMDSEYEGGGSDVLLLDRRLDFDPHIHVNSSLSHSELQSKTHELQQYKFKFLNDEVTGLLQTDLTPSNRQLLVRLRDYHSAAVTDAKKWKAKYERLFLENEILRGDNKVATTASSHSDLKAVTLSAQVEDLKIKCNQLSDQLHQTSGELVRETERKKDADIRAKKQEELLQDAWLKLQAVSRAEAASRLMVTEANALTTELKEKIQRLVSERNEVDLLLAESNVCLLQTQTSLLNLQSKEEIISNKLNQAKEFIHELQFDRLSLIDRIENIDSSYTRETNLLEEALRKGIEKDNIIHQCNEEIKNYKINIENLNRELVDLHKIFEDEKTTNKALTVALDKESHIRTDVEFQLRTTQDHVANLQVQIAEKVATIATLSSDLRQKSQQAEELSAALEQQQRRGDALDIDLSKHKELICFINKISAETEAKKNLV